MTVHATFHEVVARAKGLSNLARALGVSRQVASNWRHRSFPPSRCKQIEAVTGVSVKRLRPDDWQTFWPAEAKPSAKRTKATA